MTAARYDRAPQAWARVELKYWLSARTAEAARRFIRPFVIVDPLTESSPTRDQRVTSLYLDTPQIDFYRQHLACAADRFKLRVRFYGDAPRDVAFFEVKRKVGHVIDKRRARVPVADVQRLLRRGIAPSTGARESQRHLRWFLSLMTLHQAAPEVLVTCRREAYSTQGLESHARVTFDRDIAYQAVTTATLVGNPNRWAATQVEAGGVLLELKYSGPPPWWMRELAQRLGRCRVGYSKYVAAVGLATGEADSWLDELGVPA